MLRQGAWPRENPVFWKELAGVADQIRYIEFTGGEPFMIQEHFDLLQTIVSQGFAKQIEIHYNTNGTQYPEHAEHIWKHFKCVEIAFSIDDIGPRFEYQRANARWTEVCANLDRFRDLREIYKNIRMQVCTTVNIFNVMYLEDVALWISLQDFDYVYWNMLHDAPCYSIANMPVKAKQLAEARLRAADVDPATRHEFDRMVDFMNNGADCDLPYLHDQIKRTDRRRGEDMAVILPLLADAIDYDQA
jgi:glutamate-1-semialdehyde 2,1-aminomutase